MSRNKYYTVGWEQPITLEVDNDLLKYVNNINVNECCILIYDFNEKKTIIKNEYKHKRKRFTEYSIELSEVVTIDIGSAGVRWEGTDLNGEPCGYGCIYNENNQILYCGIIFDGKKVCFGKEYYYDTNKVEYCGNFVNGLRHGWGSLYDKEEKLIYEGEWAFGRNTFDLKIEDLDVSMIHNLLRELNIGDNCCSHIYKMRIVKYESLKSIRIGDESCRNVDLLEITDCNELEMLKIGMRSFRNGDCKVGIQKQLFMVQNCSKLMEISASDYSFGEKFKRVKLHS